MSNRLRRTPDQEELFTLKDAASLISCHVETLRLRIRRGKLDAERGPHGAYLIDDLDLTRLAVTVGRRVRRGRGAPSADELNASWEDFDGYLGRHRTHRARLVQLIGELRSNPGANRKLYRLVSVHRLRRLGLNFEQIGEVVGMSSRQARRLARRDPRRALLYELFGPTTRNRQRARALVAGLRARLETAGFRRAVRPRRKIRHPLRRSQALPPAFLVNKLRDYEIRALTDAGLTDDEIRAISLIGMGSDEINELMTRPVPPAPKNHCESLPSGDPPG